MSGAAEPVAEERRDVPFDSFGAAYHQLIWELVGLQLDSLRLVLGQSPVRRLYVDGGFAGNELYLHMLADAAPGMEVIAAEASLGSALGAALAVRRTPLPEAFLERCYRLRNIG